MSPATYDEVRRLLVMIDKKVAMRSRTRRKARSNRPDPPAGAFRATQEQSRNKTARLFVLVALTLFIAGIIVWGSLLYTGAVS